MSMRLRFVLVGLGCTALVAIWFLFMFRPNRERIAELRDQISATEEEITSLEAQLLRLQQLQREEPRLRAELARFGDALPPDPRVPDFILQVQDAANLSGIDFLSITPSVPAPGAAGFSVISVSISTTGDFFEVEDFIFRLERLQRALRINSFSLGGDPGALGVSLSMHMFTLPQAGPAPAAPPAGSAPAPSPSPGASPSPSPTATPGAA